LRIAFLELRDLGPDDPKTWYSPGPEGYTSHPFARVR
jgi:hypothetical protein